MNNHAVLKISNISLSLKNMERPILQEINLELKRGEFLILLGGNGSGKTSLMRVIKRQLLPNQGNMYFLNDDYGSHQSKKVFFKNMVSLTQDPTESLFSEMTVLENCLVWEQRYKSHTLKLSSSLDKAFYGNYLSQFHVSLGLRLNTKVELLSGGEKQALLLALAGVKPPRLLLLDEHTAALDPAQARYMMQLSQQMILQHKITTIMTTHNLDHALEYGDRILALKEGKIVFSAEGQEKIRLTKEQLLQVCY